MASGFTDQVVCALGEQSQTRPTRLEGMVGDLKTKEHQDELLDPLTLLAHLVPSPDAGADALLEVVREVCSPKEVIVASEELLEGLSRRVEEGKGEKEEEEVSLMCQVSRLVRLFTGKSLLFDPILVNRYIYIAVIARSPRGSRRRKASNMIHSFVPELGLVIRVVCESEGENAESATELLSACADLVEGIIVCLDDEEKETCKNILLPFLISTTTSLSPFIPSSLSHHVFARCFPRLNTTVAPEKESEVMQRLVRMYSRLGGRWDDSFVLWAHAVVLGLDHELRHIPFILAAIRSNSFLDHALAVLLIFFSPSPPSPPSSSSCSEPLLTLLPALASAHPDPFIRLCAFRLFSLVLRATPGVLQIQVLVDLLSSDHHNNNNPHSNTLRIAAVGLVKDLVLDALCVSGENNDNNNNNNNILASPAFVLSLAPVLFTPPGKPVLDPTSPVHTEEREVDSELTRLGHVLALYYVLEKTDLENRTGIRDPDNRANIERTLIAPIRSAVSRWALQSDVPPSPQGIQTDIPPSPQGTRVRSALQTDIALQSDIPPPPSPQGTRTRAALVALQMGVERIDEMWRARGLDVGCKV